MAESFGKVLRERDFQYDPTSVHLTNGSWGGPPLQVKEAQKRLVHDMEWEPDHFFRRKVPDLWFKYINVVAEFIGAKPENVVFVENATTGINCVMKSLPLEKGDGILTYTWTYNAIRNTCLSAAAKAGAEIIDVEVYLPVKSREEFIDNYRATLDKHPNIKVAVIDWISSPTATVVPVKEIVALCRERNVLTMIDGAHTPGQVNVDIENLGADFYTGNIHKWVFCPRGCAVLWVDPKHQNIIRPVVTSHSYLASDWRLDFSTAGTRDVTAYFSSGAAIGYYNSLGGLSAVSKYNSSLLDKAVDLLLKKWNTEKFPIPKDMEAPYMRIVKLPYLGEKYTMKTKPKGVFGDMNALMVDLYDRFNTVITALFIEEQPWVRLSCHVYNTLEEYDRLADYVLKLKAENNDE